ncbi:MAG: molybdopterin oxidoreductase family protein [Bacillota bacterium]|nr:MAG: molybdopterin oxidoreductase [Bacillota bacterium]
MAATEHRPQRPASARAPEPGTEVRFSVCPHDCWDTCALQVFLRDGRVVRVAGDPEHPVTRGFVCFKVNHYEERVYSPDRVLYPLKRVGPKGEGRFVRISWDEALDLIASRLKAIVQQYGGEAVLPYSYAGTMGLLGYGSMDRRFFHKLGASLLDRTICSAAGTAALRYTYGERMGPDPEDIPGGARLILVWGLNVVSSNVHQAPILQEARRRGATVVVIDPYNNGTARLADWYLAPRPGTDAALALGMMHVILTEGLQDQEYIDRHTVGFDRLRETVLAWPPERAAAVTGIPGEEIRRLGRMYGEEHRSLIRCGYGMQRHSGGGMAMRALAILPALTGAWRYPGCGLLLSNSGSYRWNYGALERPDLLPEPRPRTVNMNRLGWALTELRDPPVMALFVYNSNPAGVAPNQNRVIQGLLREDLFTVVHEQLMTDTARYADVVLPATTMLEHLDLYWSYWHLYVMLAEPVIPPQGEAVPNTELFRRLAAAMGFTDPCFRDSDEELILQALEGSAAAAAAAPHLTGRAQAEAALALLSRQKWLKIDRSPAPFAEGGFATPSGKIELYSETLARAGLPGTVAYIPPHESPDGAPELYRRYPIQLITPAAHHFLNTTFANLPSHMAGEQCPPLYLNPADAEARGLRDGDWARVYNDRGEVYLKVRVGEWSRPGVAISPSLWWNRFSPGGRNVNALTSDALSDMGGGAVFHSNLVEVTRVPEAEAQALEREFQERTRDRLGRREEA